MALAPEPVASLLRIRSLGAIFRLEPRLDIHLGTHSATSVCWASGGGGAGRRQKTQSYCDPVALQSSGSLSPRESKAG